MSRFIRLQTADRWVAQPFDRWRDLPLAIWRLWKTRRYWL